MRRIVTWIVLPFLALELVLQAGALLAWWRHDRDSAPGSGPAALCIGDSMVFGVGRSHEDAAYPAQLERILRDRTGSPWRVVNVGWPGQDSRQTLERLPAQLARTHPRHVLVTVGMNDMWNRPAALSAPPAAAQAEGFRLELRVARLWRLLRAGGAPPAAAEHEAPALPPELSGTWHMEQVPVAFEPGGVLLAGDAAGRWRLDGEILCIQAPGIEAIPYRWSQQGDRLLLTSATAAPLLLTRAPPDGARPGPAAGVLQAAWQSLYAGDLATAERLGARIASQVDDPQVHEFLHVLQLRTGRRQQAEEHLQWLVARHRQSRERSVAEALGRALGHCDATGSRLAALTELAAEWPESAAIHGSLAIAAAENGDRALSLRAWERTLDRRAQLPPHDQAELLGRCSVFMAEDDPPRALRLILEAVRLGASTAVTRHRLQARRNRFDRAMLEETMARLEATPEERAAWPRMFDQAMDLAEALAVLARHLGFMAALCREHGARLFLVPYPAGHLEIAETLAKVAADEQLVCVDVAADFNRARASLDWLELFTADGHCTDKGYGILAAAAAAAVLSR